MNLANIIYAFAFFTISQGKKDTFSISSFLDDIPFRIFITLYMHMGGTCCGVMTSKFSENKLGENKKMHIYYI